MAKKPLLEGSRVAVLVPEEPTFTLSQEDEIALLEAIQEADRGELVDGRELLDRLP